MSHQSIQEICKLEGITSRTLRYYEEQGVLSSVRQANKNERYYSQEQQERIRDILLLRSFHVPIKEMKRYFDGEASLGEILKRHCELLQEEYKKIEDQIHQVNRVKTMLGESHNIYESIAQKGVEKEKQARLAFECGQHFIKQDTLFVYHLLPGEFQKIITNDKLEQMWNYYVEHYGKVESIDKMEQEEQCYKFYLNSYIQKGTIAFRFHGPYIVVFFSMNTLFALSDKGGGEK